jgi:hypothetical protein
MDYSLFIEALLSTNPNGDLNDDGVSDVYDWGIFHDAFNNQRYSPWYIPSSGAAALPDSGGAPRVIDVIVSGSTSTHAPFSFSTVDGSGLQLRTVPVGAADTISIVFSEDVNVVGPNLRVVGLQTGNIPTLAQFSYDSATKTAMWRFQGWVLGDQYLISLSDSVTDLTGNRLDGEWVNPATLSTANVNISEFPSGNGFAGGHFNFVATLLSGDYDLDGIVNQTDYYIFDASWQSGIFEDALFTDGDGNGDGSVDSGDFAAYMSTSGLNLQALWILADLDGDFDVDQADAQVLKNNVGISNPTWANGDLNEDGAVDSLDVDLMFALYGLDLEVVS